MPSQTLAERILSTRLGRSVRAGEFVVCPVDLAYVQDGMGPQTFRQMERMGLSRAAKPDRSVAFLDHAAPPPRPDLAADHVYLREFAAKAGIRLHDVGDGVCHQVAFERYVRPGDVVVGADGHAVMGGAMGAFATGMGSADLAIALGMGKTWLRVPESMRLEVRGQFPRSVMSKDLMLKLLEEIGSGGATYRSIEWCGPAIRAMSMPERMALANMAVETGGKCGLVASDGATMRYLREQGREGDWDPFEADPDAAYEKVLEYDVADLEPLIALPGGEGRVVPVSYFSLKEVPIHEVYVGTCANGRFEDVEAFAKLVAGEVKAEHTRVIITPASRDAYRRMLKAGLVSTLLDFGATINSPGCGACAGLHGGVPGDGENVLSTQNRNYAGRMGNPNAFVYLASPTTAAATALYGEIVDPRTVV